MNRNRHKPKQKAPAASLRKLAAKALIPIQLRTDTMNIGKTASKGKSNQSLTYMFEVREKGKTRIITIQSTKGTIASHIGEVLVALIEQRTRGITNFQPSHIGRLELRDYIYRLRKRKGRFKLKIKSRKEAHTGGTHMRYFLLSNVTLLSAPPTPDQFL